jgi:hypothetical protein
LARSVPKPLYTLRSFTETNTSLREDEDGNYSSGYDTHRKEVEPKHAAVDKSFTWAEKVRKPPSIR